MSIRRIRTWLSCYLRKRPCEVNVRNGLVGGIDADLVEWCLLHNGVENFIRKAVNRQCYHKLVVRLTEICQDLVDSEVINVRAGEPEVLAIILNDHTMRVYIPVNGDDTLVMVGNLADLVDAMEVHVKGGANELCHLEFLGKLGVRLKLGRCEVLSECRGQLYIW